MLQSEDYEAEQMGQLILAAVTEIFREQDFEQFSQWALKNIPLFLGANENLSDVDWQRLGLVLAITIWNATPLPNHGYRPQPITLPQLNEPCICGSGLLFKNCCAVADHFPEMPVDLIWEIILDELHDHALQDALEQEAVPKHLFVHVANRWLDADQPMRVLHLLEPMFEEQIIMDLDERFEPVLDALCDTYDRLGYWRKKQRFLKQVARKSPRCLQAVAWQRLTMIFIDDDNLHQARIAFEHALKKAPEHPANALVEITLLTVDQQINHARSRALFWKKRLQRLNHPSSLQIIDFLDHAHHNPCGALVDLYEEDLESHLMLLRRCIHLQQQRAVPTYLVEVYEAASTSTMEQLVLPTSPDWPAPKLFNHHGIAALCPPISVQRLERRWRQSVPSLHHLTASLDDIVTDLWDDPTWLKLLRDYPEAFDSLSILDDLVTLITYHPDEYPTWILEVLIEPIISRASTIVDVTMSHYGAFLQLPWFYEANQPALRLLSRLADYYLDNHHDTQQTMQLLELILSLDPYDQQHIRAKLMNYYLMHRENEQALALTKRFPKDVLAELVYGKALALYRLKDYEQAAYAVQEAVTRLPRIVDYLIKKRVKKPAQFATAEHFVGSEAQGWFYRQATYPLWKKEPELLLWLSNAVVSTQ
jgi:tetratricopeptide (TPR) repeat protein